MAGTALKTNARAAAGAPGRKAKSFAGRSAARPTMIGRVFARPGMIVAGATFAAVMTGIVANALLFQKGHHPSPLFGTVPTPPVALLAPPTVVPAPMQPPAVPEPAAAAPVSQEPAPAPAPAVKPTASPPHKPAAKPAHSVSMAATKPAHKPASVVRRDPIGDLLGKQGH